MIPTDRMLLMGEKTCTTMYVAMRYSFSIYEYVIGCSLSYSERGQRLLVLYGKIIVPGWVGRSAGRSAIDPETRGRTRTPYRPAYTCPVLCRTRVVGMLPAEPPSLTPQSPERFLPSREDGCSLIMYTSVARPRSAVLAPIPGESCAMTPNRRIGRCDHGQEWSPERIKQMRDAAATMPQKSSRAGGVRLFVGNIPKRVTEEVKYQERTALARRTPPPPPTV